MLKGKNMSNGFSTEAINTVVYLKNRSPTKSLHHKTPFEALYGYKPIVSHLRVFGSKEFSHVFKEDRRKLDAKAINCYFLGCCDDHKTYKIFDPRTHKVFARKDVLFHEHVKEGHKMDNYGAWHILYDYDENVKEVLDVEQEQEHGEDSKNMDTSSSHNMPRRGGRLIVGPKINSLSFGVAISKMIMSPLPSTKGFSFNVRLF